MARNLTQKQVEYIDTLIERNNRETVLKDSTPLEEPMSVNERQIRFRIRKKAHQMVRDLLKIHIAGICDAEEVIDAYFNNTAVWLPDKYNNKEGIELKEMILYH